MKKYISILLILLSVSVFSQIKIEALPSTNTGTTGDFLIKNKAAGGVGSTQKISIADFKSLYFPSLLFGTGTTNRIPRFTGLNSIEDGALVDDGTDVTMPSGGTFKIDGQLRLTPSAGSGKVLTSDGTGYATWQTLSTGVSGATGYIPLFTGSTAIGNSYLKQEGANISLTSGKYISGSDSTKIRVSFGTAASPLGTLTADGGTLTYGGRVTWGASETSIFAIPKLLNKVGGIAVDTTGLAQMFGDSIVLDSYGRLDINATTLKINIPSKASGRVLTSDANGMATWQTPSGGGTWGSITGTLSSQTDLQTALNAKASLSGTETLTNKTFTDNVTFFQDESDNTKKAQLQLSGITTATTRTYTLPDVSTTILGRNGSGVNLFIPRFNGVNEVVSSNYYTTNGIFGINMGGLPIVGCEFVQGGSTTVDSYGRWFAGGDFYIYSGSTTSAAANRFGVSVRNRLFIESSHSQGLYIGSTTTAPIVFNSNNAEIARFITTGQLGIGVSSPTASIHLKAGTASASSAPIKLTSGTLNTTAEVGAFEFVTDDLTFTGTTGTTRKRIADYSYRGIATDRTLDGSDELVNVTSGNRTITLPTAVGYNKNYIIKNSGTGIVSIATTSSQTIDALAASNFRLAQYDWIELRSNGSNWIISNRNGILKTFYKTFTASEWRGMGTTPLVCLSAISANAIIHVLPGTLCVRKNAGTVAFDFITASEVVLLNTGYRVAGVDNTFINSGTAVKVQIGAATADYIDDPYGNITLTTDDGSDATVGDATVTVTFNYTVNLL